ncbi:MAG: hypothetical protein KA230_08530 [Flavobacteriales bacterium]|nr:hypothetical protein [Flavobacteriales bacterium]
MKQANALLGTWWGRALYYLLTGTAIAVIALINGYPLVYSDSGTYIMNAFTLEQIEDRPIGYGLIIHAITWKATLWTVVLFQGAVTSWLLMLLVRSTAVEATRWLKLHLMLLAVLIVGTSLPWYAAQIMADVFTPLVMIIVFLLYNGSVQGKARRVALWLLLFFFLAAHNSHFPILLGLQGLLLGAHVIGRRVFVVPRDRFWRKWWSVNAVAMGAALMIMLFNAVPYGQFRLSRASNAFVAGRLCEDGIMADYLNATCGERPHPLCAYKDRLPADALNGFLWSDTGFVRGEGLSLAEADSVLAPLVSDLLGRPEYAVRYARSMVRSTGQQLLQWETGAGLHAYGEGTSPHAHLWWRLPHEKAAYEGSMQQRGAWADLSGWNRLVGAVLLVSLLAIGAVAVLRFRSLTSMHWALMVWVASWLLLNAFVTSSLSIVDSRMQSRVVWLVPMVAVFLVAATLPPKRPVVGPEEATLDPAHT